MPIAADQSWEGEDEVTRVDLARPLGRADDEQEHDRRGQREAGEGSEGGRRAREDDEPGDSECQKDCEEDAASAREGLQHVPEVTRGVAGGHVGARADLGVVAIGEPEPRDGERHSEQADRRHLEPGAEGPAAPDGERDDRLGDQHQQPVGMRSGQEHGGCRRGERRPPRPQVERPDEEDGRERGHEGEERVHPAEAPVDPEHGRGGGDRRRGHARRRSRQPAAELEAERDRAQRERDREPPERLERRVEREADVGEDEVKRRAAPVPEHGLDDLGERPSRHQAAQRLVLVDRQPRDVRCEPRRQVGDREPDRRPDDCGARGLSLRGAPCGAGRARRPPGA